MQSRNTVTSLESLEFKLDTKSKQNVFAQEIKTESHA